jgi:DNA-binding LacI/PurR family transcriptional regulator
MDGFAKLAQPPTAVFATSDLFTCGVMQALNQQGKRVPEDVTLVGYDDTLSAMLAPPITSIGLSLDAIGQHAIDLILRRMNDPQAPAKTVRVRTVLIDRGSVRPLA